MADGGRERDGKAHVFERERGRGGVVGMRLVHSASQHLWPLSVSLSLPLTDVNNNSASTERTQVSTIVRL